MPGNDIFALPNLVAWCIVPFDAAGRGPEERAAMLVRLGLRRLAYDWRDKDVPTFDDELAALKRHGIELTAFWLPLPLEPEQDETIALVLELIRRHRVRPQLWVIPNGPANKHIEGLESDSRKVEAAAAPVGYLAAQGAKVGAQVGLYNHGGWFGEPENQSAIIRRLGFDNVGVVYNFHHGHEHIARFAELFARMQPHLIALNINGMRAGGPKILPVGAGDRELEMLRIVKRSGWRGPVGILDHRPELDAEESLRQNIEGLERLRKEL
mgnify:CR=1 FL=1